MGEPRVIKEKETEAWLTDGQRAAYDPIISQWATSMFINLCGPPGCGKSFVARLLAAEHNYAYTHDLLSTPPNTENVVVDDAEYTRLMRATAQVLGIGRVIVVTRTPVRDPMPRAVIQLNERDVRQFMHNLYAHGGIEFVASSPSGINLAQMLQAEVIARGGDDVD